MRNNVTTLGWAHIIVSGLHLFVGIVALIVMGMFGGLATVTGGQEAHAALPVMLIFGMIVFGISAVLAIPGFLVGWGLITLQPWARAGGIVLSVLEITVAPVGTILGIVGLIVLCDSNNVRLFEHSGSPLPYSSLRP